MGCSVLQNPREDKGHCDHLSNPTKDHLVQCGLNGSVASLWCCARALSMQDCSITARGLGALSSPKDHSSATQSTEMPAGIIIQKGLLCEVQITPLMTRSASGSIKIFFPMCSKAACWQSTAGRTARAEVLLSGCCFLTCSSSLLCPASFPSAVMYRWECCAA